MTNYTISILVNEQSLLFGHLILTNNWGFSTNVLNISLDRIFPCIHDIVMGIRSVSPSTLTPRHPCMFMTAHGKEELTL